jgi:uncharacterized protein (DUF952 family)
VDVPAIPGRGRHAFGRSGRGLTLPRRPERVVRKTLHLVPLEVWAASDPDRPYEAASLATEGFIHCTDGEDELVATANRHYRDDRVTFLALTVDLDAVGAPSRIEDARGVYPHVFGPIERRAILDARPMVRDDDGRFIAVGDPVGPEPG